MKFYSYFTPNLKESWILTFYLIVIGGIVSGVIVLLLNLIFPESSIVTNIIGYILTFLPALLVIRRKSKIKEADYKIDDNKKPIIKLNGSNFGKINPILFFFLLLLSIPAINIILDPFTEFLKSPEWFNKIMEQAVGGNFIVSIISVAILAPLP